MADFTLIPRAALVDSPWSNGAGRKADIAGGPGYHVGFATLETDAPFSDFTGQDRTITLLEGPGFTLEFPTGALSVTRPHQPAAFDGGTPTLCRVTGRCTVLNAMTRRDAHTHRVTIGPAAPLTRAGQELLFAIVLAGRLDLPDGRPAGRFDSLQIHRTLVCEGDAILAAIRLSPR